MLKIYVRDMADYWGYRYKDFNPTGRWKILIVDGDVHMYLEHKGWIFSYWYHEEDIIFTETETFINECN